MSRFRIDDKLPQFDAQQRVMLGNALKETASNVLRKSRQLAPYSGTKAMRQRANKSGRGTGGHLRADSDVEVKNMLMYEVHYYKEYARYQHAGGDGTRVVRNYTTPNTGKEYLTKAGDMYADQFTATARKHLRRMGL